MPAAKVAVVPWAVPRTMGKAAGFAARAGVAMLGSFARPAHLDAAVWLVEAVMPLVWRDAPDMVCQLAGSDPPRFVQDAGDPRITTGPVADLGAFLRRVRVCVAPLQYGAGLPAMVVDSLAAGVPCVCTPLAAEGFGFVPPLDGLVADGAEAAAALILRIHHSKALFDGYRRAGLDYVAERFSEAALDTALVAALQAAGLCPAPHQRTGSSGHLS